MTCPDGLKPFCYDQRGNPCPMIVPVSALEHYRRLFKGVWIIPSLSLPRNV